MVTSWLNEFNIGIGYLNEKLILLGVTNEVENYRLINHILIIGKQVIYSCRCKNVRPNLTLFQIKVREVYKIEFMISRKKQKEITNYKKLHPFWYIYYSFLHLTATFVNLINCNFCQFNHSNT